MTTEERLSNIESALVRVAATQGNIAEGRLKMAGLIKGSVQVQVTLHERVIRLEEAVHEIDDKLNGLIAVIDGLIRNNDGPRDLPF